MENIDWSEEAKKEALRESPDEAAYKNALQGVVEKMSAGDKEGAVSDLKDAGIAASDILDAEKRREALQTVGTLREKLIGVNGHEKKIAEEPDGEGDPITELIKDTD